MSNSKLILLTGATRGLGLAMTERFIAAGHRVIGCGRDSSAIQKLNDQHATQSRFDSVDVSSEQQVKEWAKQVLESHGVPDLLINNAATINTNAPLWQVSESEFADVTEILSLIHI